MAEHLIEIHTSDRQLFKRCRRKWGWGSRLRANLVPDGADGGAMWLGSGVHFALEDFHGWNRFNDPRMAFRAYIAAHKRDELPADVDKLEELGLGMLDYYANYWLDVHPEPYETLWLDDKPQVEVEIQIDITDQVLTEAAMQGRISVGTIVRELKRSGGSIVYVCTFDRVVVTPTGEILGVDYKTAKQFDHYNLATNPQAEAYDWGLDIYYADYVVDGIVWQQHFKAYPEPPALIKKGTAYSQDQRQHTTHTMYRRALLEKFGTVPDDYIEFLNWLAEQVSEEGDRYIRRDVLHRNATQRAAAEVKIVQEAVDMLDPGLPLYPNPTNDCSWDCPFKGPCLATDDGSDPEFMLESEYVQWEGYKDDWRARIAWPEGD